MFTFDPIYSVGKLSGTIERVHGVRLIVGVMVPIDALEHFHRDPEEPADFDRGAPRRSAFAFVLLTHFWCWLHPNESAPERRHFNTGAHRHLFGGV
jgi:hypothetical protein